MSDCPNVTSGGVLAKSRVSSLWLSFTANISSISNSVHRSPSCMMEVYGSLTTITSGHAPHAYLGTKGCRSLHPGPGERWHSSPKVLRQRPASQPEPSFMATFFHGCLEAGCFLGEVVKCKRLLLSNSSTRSTLPQHSLGMPQAPPKNNKQRTDSHSIP